MLRSSWYAQRATFPTSWTMFFDLDVAPGVPGFSEIVDIDAARPDTLNNPLVGLAPFGLQVDPANGYRESFSISNDGPAQCFFTRMFSIDDVPGPFIPIDSAPGIGIPGGTTLNRLTVSDQFVYPAFPFLVLRFENKNVLNSCTVHVVYTLRAK